MLLQNNLRERILKTAETKKIPFQRHASSRFTGTDTDAFAYSNGGVASALISLPLRYMHTTVEMVHREDVENVIKLIYETVQTIKNGETFSYFDFIGVPVFLNQVSVFKNCFIDFLNKGWTFIDKACIKLD